MLGAVTLARVCDTYYKLKYLNFDERYVLQRGSGFYWPALVGDIVEQSSTREIIFLEECPTSAVKSVGDLLSTFDCFTESIGGSAPSD